MSTSALLEVEYSNGEPSVWALPNPLPAPIREGHRGLAQLRGSPRVVADDDQHLHLHSLQKLAHSRRMGRIEHTPGPERPLTPIEIALQQYDLASESLGRARESLQRLIRIEHHVADEALVSQARHRVAAKDVTLADLNIRHADVRDLVAQNEHNEILRRFAVARQHLGLDALQVAYESYQRAIGALDDSGTTRWSREQKAWLISHLNAAAGALCAYLTVGDSYGQLSWGGAGQGTFQLVRPGQKRLTLGQRLPALGLRAKDAQEMGVTL